MEKPGGLPEKAVPSEIGGCEYKNMLIYILVH
jgi:hypothetical protein